MRILIATSHRNLVGGVEKYLQAILPCLAKHGHELALLYEYRFDPAKERIDPLDIEIPCAESGAGALPFVRNWKPDVVYSQGLEDAGLQSALLNEYPNVLYAHNYVGTCISGEKCHAFPSPQPCGRTFGPTCLALYYPRRCGGLNPVTAWKMYQRSDQRNEQLQRYSAILVASEHMREEYGRHTNPEKIRLAALPNPQQAVERRPEKRQEPVGKLLFVGRLTNLKGAGHLLRAIPMAERKLRRPLALTVAGDGPERASLEKFASRNALTVEFTGWVETRQKEFLMQQADLLVVPSLWPEPFGLVGIEAGAHGLPAVAYNTGGISDWLIPGYSGELAPGDPPTVEGLADTIARALSGESHYEKLCRGAREVAGRFSLSAHLSKLESTLQEIVQEAIHV